MAVLAEVGPVPDLKKSHGFGDGVACPVSPAVGGAALGGTWPMNGGGMYPK